jgi:TonB family protein
MTGSIRVALCLTCLVVAPAAAQDPLTRARGLYESAAYEESLVELGRLKAETPAPAVADIDYYRVLCLMALSRAAEADKVIESLLMNDPLYQPAAADAPPRVRASFNAVRQRVLPGVARQLYIDAKGLYDRKQYADAATALEKTVNVIDNVDAAQKSDVADLRLLAAGFLDLARAAAAAPPAAPAPAPTTAAASPAPPARSAPALPASTNLVVLKQDLPPLPFALAAGGKQEYRGIIEVQIDATGKVSDAKMVQSVHALYDPLLLQAARQWLYEPPRSGGNPTASRKRVEVVLRP